MMMSRRVVCCPLSKCDGGGGARVGVVFYGFCVLCVCMRRAFEMHRDRWPSLCTISSTLTYMNIKYGGKIYKQKPKPILFEFFADACVCVSKYDKAPACI